MRISPSVASSKPAIMRMVVVLPQPDGPSRTKNSLSAMVRSKLSTPTKLPQRLPIFRNCILAIIINFFHTYSKIITFYAFFQAFLTSKSYIHIIKFLFKNIVACIFYTN